MNSLFHRPDKIRDSVRLLCLLFPVMILLLSGPSRSVSANPLSVRQVSVQTSDIPSANRNSSIIILSTGSTKGVYYPLGKTIAEILNETDDSHFIHIRESGGSVDNTNRLKANEAQLALVQNDIACEYHEKGYKDVVAITSLYSEMIQIIARDDAGINEIADLRGKIISVGKENSGAERNSREILHIAGFIRDKDYFPRYESFDKLVEIFRAEDEIRHAAFITASVNVPVIENIGEIAKGKNFNIKLIPLNDFFIDRLLSQKSKSYEKMVIPEGSYYFQKKPVNTIGVRALLVCRKDLPDDLINGYIKTLSDNAAEIMKRMDKKGLKVKIDISDKGISIPLHPGARTFFLKKKALRILPYILLILIVGMFTVIWTAKKIKGRTTNGASGTFTRIDNVYIVGNPIRNSEMFFGREETFTELGDWIGNDGPKVILLKGGRRSGKTSILLQILNGRLCDVGEPVFCDFHHITPQVRSDEDLPLQIGNAILSNEQFRDLHDRFINSAGEWTTRLMEITELCVKRIAPKKLVILGDEFEAIEDAFQSGLLSVSALNWIIEILDLPIHLIMTGSQDFGDMLGHVLNPVKQSLDITLLSENDTKDLICEPMKGKLDFHGNTVDIIYRLSGGHPFYTQYICQTLISHINSTIRRNYIIPGDIDEVIAFIVQNPHGHIQETWRNLPVKVKSTLAAMANTINNPKKFVTPKEILSTVRERRFMVEDEDCYEAISWLKSQTHLHLLDWDSKSIRFQIDLIRFWIRHYFQTGEDIRNISA